ncbi:hypothetical protein CKF54_04015 [Psittacicella hinzii]|uniref:CDP-glycerol:poly(Glycerophosphate) glycerophosphotransferase n=1 Tax=Psittacicella hinzii TaxID=2028575 RepID=A0A3A1Y9S3_9GAMM|nr:CDP-glycerol glycerophosphotransferase family protein [Psittacicella hinzii]RIY32867.1 hypothetical protein CKF54_04015 [Psittacicella hinzii]
MSKLTKLFKNPSLFFKDAVKNLNTRLQSSNSSTNGKASGKAKSAKAKKVADTFLTHNLNPYKNVNFVVHTGENCVSGAAHLSQWIPYLCQSGYDFIVMVRNVELFKWVAKEYPYISVAYTKKIDDIENLFNSLPYLKAVLYLSNTGNLIHSLRFNKYEHIFLGHGDSDKTSSAQKFFRVYDQIWTAGQAHIDRFENAGFNISNVEFVKVGRPQLFNVIKQTEAPWTERPNKILYLPTWEGVFEETNYSSINFSKDIIASITKEFNVPVVTKFHPSSGIRNPLLKNISSDVRAVLLDEGVDTLIVDKDLPVEDITINSNIFICDISGVVSECIAANGPIFVFVPQDRDIRIAPSKMSYDYYAYTFSNLEELLAQLREVLNGNDYKAERREEARNYLIGKEQTLNREFYKKLEESVSATDKN